MTLRQTHSNGERSPERSEGRSRTAICLILIASLIVIIDRFTKFLVFNNFFQNQSVEIIPRVFHLTLVLNTGAAFGLFRDKNYFFVAASLIVITLIFVYALLRRFDNLAVLIALGMIMGGAIGNLIDRLAFGCIIDFLDFRVWPVFNIADSSITVGSALLILNIFFNKKCSTQ